MTLPLRLRWLWLTLAVVLLDRATKAIIETKPLKWDHDLIRNYIWLVHSENPGIGFSLLANWHSPWAPFLLILSSFAIIAAIVWLLVTSATATRLTLAGFALLLGGAAGNVTDRILHGAVTDFLVVSLPFLPTSRFNPWPAFNVADSTIFIGAVLILLDVLFGRKQQSPQSG
jgi:signal peptidase II